MDELGQAKSICSVYFNVASHCLAYSTPRRSNIFNFDCSVGLSRRGKLIIAISYIVLQAAYPRK